MRKSLPGTEPSPPMLGWHLLGPKDLAEDIVENIEAGLANFRTVLAALNTK